MDLLALGNLFGFFYHLNVFNPIGWTLLDGSNVRLNWNIESDMNVNWIKFKNFLSLYWFKNKQHWI